MINTIPKSVKIWGSGQLTIPKDIRDNLDLNEDSQVNIFVIGKSVIMTPKKLLRASLSKKIEKSMKKENISLNDLLSDLKIERKNYVEKKFSK